MTTQLRERGRSPSVDPLQADPAALIPEARRRTRRRRARLVIGILLLAGLGVAIVRGAHGESGGSIAQLPEHRLANIAAFRGEGSLAFISQGTAWVLDGDRGTLRRLPAPARETPSSPMFSPDGRWLAYLVTRDPGAGGRSALWIARSDGTAAHRVRGLAVDQLVGWSSHADLVAVTAGDSRHAPIGMATTLLAVSPTGGVRQLFTPSRRLGAIWSAVWSPDGRSLAVSTYDTALRQGTHIFAVPVSAAARPRVWLAIRNSQRLTGRLSCGPHCASDEVIAQLAGWWRRWGIAFWVDSSGMTHNADATPLTAITRPGARPRLIADTLSDGVTDAVAASGQGALAVVASTPSAGRNYAAGKTVERCSPIHVSCTPLPDASVWDGTALPCHPCSDAPARGPGSAVSLDPAWSPRGELLAYVEGPADRAGGNPSLTWFQAHELDIWNARTNTTRRIGAISGTSLPTWSRDGRQLLYVSQDGLWLADVATGRTVEIEHPLYRPSTWNDIRTGSLSFWGQIPWRQQFSWSSP